MPCRQGKGYDVSAWSQPAEAHVNMHVHVLRPEEVPVSPIPWPAYMFLRRAGQLLMTVLAIVMSQACCSKYLDSSSRAT